MKQIRIFREKREFESFQESLIVLQQNQTEALYAKENKINNYWFYIGFCEVCNAPSKFLMDWNYSNWVIPNFRERLVCEKCKLNNRQRFMMSFVDHKISNEDKKLVVYCYEQVTYFYKVLKEKFDTCTIIGSEYLGYDIDSGVNINGIQHEDALNLSFKDNSIDIIISNDVYEHVPNIKKSLKEAYRVLNNDGKVFITIPFHQNNINTVERAYLQSDGKIKNVLPEIYHGNPISEKGSLVFYDYGWDFLDVCKEVGFRDAYVLSYYSELYAYLGAGNQTIFVLEK